MNTILKPGWPLAAIVALLFCTAAGLGQTNQGQIAGNVLDPSGAGVANASIAAKSEESGASYTTASSDTGNYRFPSIPLGRYTITTAAPGFRSAVSTGVQVRVGSTTSLDISLAPGGATDTVTVESNAPTLETQSSDVGGTVTAQQIVDLPLALGGVGAMRSPESFVFLIPGTAGPGTANSNNGIFLSKIGGGQNFGNEVLLDGASQTRSENGSSFDEEAPSVEAISEFKVTTSTPAAEFGRTTGGIENFVTKSGGNSFHGTAFDIFRNEALDANTWFNNGYKAYYQSLGNPSESNYNRGSDKQNDYGGSLGGPVSIPHFYNGRDKTFFFFAWEQFRQNLGGVTTSTVPTTAERAGNFQDQLIGGPNGQINPCDGTAIQNGQIFDPATTRVVDGVPCRTAFPNNTIPQGRFSPVAQKLLAFYPEPTGPGITNNYSLKSSSPIVNTTYTIRIDESLGSSNNFYGSYSTRENTRHSPTNLTLPSPVDPDTQTQDFITHFGRGGWDHVFSPSLLNHFNAGFNRSNSINGSIESGTDVDWAQQLGIANIVKGFPRINVSGVGNANYVSLSRNQNADNVDNGARVNDSISWQRGRHSFKFGGDYRYQQYSSIANDFINGYFNFTANQTKATQTGPFAGGTGIGLASLLLGNFDTAGITVPSHQPRWISNYWAIFLQDDFKISNSLVVNLGLRYDVDQPRKEAQNNTSNFSPTTIDPRSGLPGALIFGTNCKCNTRWADTWYKDIAPRIGFAFTPAQFKQKVVLRGGFATLYGPLQYSDFGGSTITGYTNPINQNSDGFNATYQIDNGLNPYVIGTNLDPGYYDSGNSAAPTAFSNWIKPSYGRPAQINQWNLQVQQEIAKDLIMTVGYIGSAGSHLKSQEENVNNAPKSVFPLGDMLNNHFSDTAPVFGTQVPYATFNTAASYVQALRPYPQYDFIATDCCLQNVGHSSYEALIVSLERRFYQGLNLQASYTWSKSITNADSIINVTNGVQQEQDPSNSKSQKSLSNQDIPHTFVTSFLYELPFGKGKQFLNFSNPVARAAMSGFQIGGVLRYQSGQPTSFGCASGIPGWQNCISFTRLPGSQINSNARRGHIDPFRQLKAGGNLPGPDPNVDSEFNGLLQPTGVNAGYAALQTAPAFLDQNQPDNRRTRAVKASVPGGDFCPDCDNGSFLFGNVPRVSGDVRNYHYNNEDFSILKKTPIGDNLVLTFKVELLNAFNRHVFGTPSTQPNDQLFGVPTYTIDSPRSMQLTARIQF